MRAKLSYAVTAAVLVFYFVLVGSRGVMLIQSGTLLTVTFGVAVLILPVIGLWFLWKNTQFARKAGQLADELDSEGGLPDDWRSWFRLAIAYHDARDTSRARKAMQRAIALHDGKPVQAA